MNINKTLYGEILILLENMYPNDAITLVRKTIPQALNRNQLIYLQKTIYIFKIEII